MEVKTLVLCLLVFVAYVFIGFISNIILEIIKANIANKALKQKIDTLYLELIAKVKQLSKDIKNEKEIKKNEM